MRRVPWPRYKERDGDLYARFMPVYRRLDRAGWQPVMHATATRGEVWVERFGARPPELYFSLYNPTAAAVKVPLAIDRNALGIGAAAPLREIVENRASIDPTQPIILPAHALRVLQVGD